MLIGVEENGKTFDATDREEGRLIETFDATDREEVEGRFLEAFSVNVSTIFC